MKGPRQFSRFVDFQYSPAVVTSSFGYGSSIAALFSIENINIRGFKLVGLSFQNGFIASNATRPFANKLIESMGVGLTLEDTSGNELQNNWLDFTSSQATIDTTKNLGNRNLVYLTDKSGIIPIDVDSVASIECYALWGIADVPLAATDVIYGSIQLIFESKLRGI